MKIHFLKKEKLTNVTAVLTVLFVVLTAVDLYVVRVLKVSDSIGSLGDLGDMLILMALLIAVLSSIDVLGWKRALGLLLLTAGWAMLWEIVGVATGFPFGSYHYTGDNLFFGIPPFLPFGWFAQSYPAFVVGRIALHGKVDPFPASGRWLGRLSAIVISSFALTAFDFVWDPTQAGSPQPNPEWVWANPGSYYGIPLSNFLGWLFTGFCIYLSMELLFRKIGPKSETPRAGNTVRHAIPLIMLLGYGISMGAWYDLPSTNTALFIALCASLPLVIIAAQRLVEASRAGKMDRE